MNTSKMIDGCILGGKADIHKEFKCQGSNCSIAQFNFNPPEKLAVDEPKVPSIRRVDQNDKKKDKEMAATQTSPFVIPPDTFKTLLENLYMARLCLLRARNVTINQLHVHKEEAIEHMKEIKCIAEEELKNPEASAASLAHELVKVSTEVIQSQQALKRIELEELVKNVDSLLNTLRADVKEAKSLAEPECKEESRQESYRDLIFDHGHLGLFVLSVLLGSSSALIIHGFFSLLNSV